MLVRSMLGLDARGGEVILDPDIPDAIGRIQITGLHAFGTRWDTEAIGRRGYVRLSRSAPTNGNRKGARS
jgi:hypothetical protein